MAFWIPSHLYKHILTTEVLLGLFSNLYRVILLQGNKNSYLKTLFSSQGFPACYTFCPVWHCNVAWNCRNPTISRSLFKLLHIFSRGLVFNDIDAFLYEKWLSPITSHGSRITLISGIRIWHYRLTPQHRLRILDIFRLWNLWNLWLIHFM